MKKLEIIETEDYFLAVSDEEIKKEDYRCNIQRGYIKKVEEDLSYYNKRNDVFKKTVGYLPKNNAPELDLPLLPEMVVEDGAVELSKRATANHKFAGGLHEEKTAQIYFRRGYRAATKIYSEEDVTEICYKLFKHTPSGELQKWERRHYLSFIQSLKQPKWFVAEIINTNNYGSEILTSSYDSGNFKLKTTTNSQGKQVLVGIYKF